ncbi:hypothetical protein I5I75_30840, partial [Pseudomonas aeruginosa]|nr:hypothetical protein [Pseudomonas aeruginosa]
MPSILGHNYVGGARRAPRPPRRRPPPPPPRGGGAAGPAPPAAGQLPNTDIDLRVWLDERGWIVRLAC